MADQNRRPCRGTNKDGTSCRAWALPGREWCPNHAPELAGWRADRNRRGGEGKSTAARVRKAMPADLRSVGDMLLEAMQAVKDGEMTPAVAHALSSLARAYVDVTEYATFEARIAAVEEATEVKAA